MSVEMQHGLSPMINLCRWTGIIGLGNGTEGRPMNWKGFMIFLLQCSFIISILILAIQWRTATTDICNLLCYVSGFLFATTCTILYGGVTSAVFNRKVNINMKHSRLSL